MSGPSPLRRVYLFGGPAAGKTLHAPAGADRTAAAAVAASTVQADAFFPQMAVAAGGSGTPPEVDVDRRNCGWSPSLMHTVFLNLLDNARKASPPDGVVTLTGRCLGEDYVVTVRDQGRGMDLPSFRKSARPFYRIDPSRSRAQGGAGLGLAICDEILKLHGFSLAFESTPGCGTIAAVTMKGRWYHERDFQGHGPFCNRISDCADAVAAAAAGKASRPTIRFIGWR